MDIKEFYLKDYDFQIFVNKNCQTYGKTLDYMLSTPTTIEYYNYLTDGGRKYGKGKPEQDQSGTIPAKDKG